MAQLPSRGFSERTMALVAVAVLGAGATFFALRGGNALLGQSVTSTSSWGKVFCCAKPDAAFGSRCQTEARFGPEPCALGMTYGISEKTQCEDACAGLQSDYVAGGCMVTCPDGYRYPSCTTEGWPINYFQDPCNAHQGSAQSSSVMPVLILASASSSRSAMTASASSSAGIGGGGSSVTAPPPPPPAMGFCCVTSRQHCGALDSEAQGGDLNSLLVPAQSCQAQGGLLWYPETFGDSQAEAFLTCNGACRAETETSSVGSSRPSSVPASSVAPASSSRASSVAAPVVQSQSSSVIGAVSSSAASSAASSVVSSSAGAQAGSSSAGFTGASSSRVTAPGSSRAFSDDTFSAVSAPRSSRRGVSSRPPLDPGGGGPLPTFIRSSRPTVWQSFSSAEAAPEEGIFTGWCCVDKAQGWFYTGYSECKDGQGERKFELGNADAPPEASCDVESPGTCAACSACGSGLTNACDADECAWLGGEANNCVFEGGLLGGSCTPAVQCAGQKCVCEGQSEAGCAADLNCEWQPGAFGGTCVQSYLCEQVFACEEGIGMQQMALYEALDEVAGESEMSICFNSRQRCDTDCL